MKTLFRNKSRFLIWAFTAFVLLFTSCKKEEIKPVSDNSSTSSAAARGESVSSSTIMHLPGLVEDINYNLNPNISNTGELYNSVDHSRIYDGVGSPLLYGDYM